MTIQSPKGKGRELLIKCLRVLPIAISCLCSTQLIFWINEALSTDKHFAHSEILFGYRFKCDFDSIYYILMLGALILGLAVSTACIFGSKRREDSWSSAWDLVVVTSIGGCFAFVAMHLAPPILNASDFNEYFGAVIAGAFLLSLPLIPYIELNAHETSRKFSPMMPLALYLVMVFLLTAFDIAGIIAGTQSVNKLLEQGEPPFSDGMYCICLLVNHPYQATIVQWAAKSALPIFLSGCFIMAFTSLLCIVKDKLKWTALSLLVLWSLLSGATGFWHTESI